MNNSTPRVKTAGLVSDRYLIIPGLGITENLRKTIIAIGQWNRTRNLNHFYNREQHFWTFEVDWLSAGLWHIVLDSFGFQFTSQYLDRFSQIPKLPYRGGFVKEMTPGAVSETDLFNSPMVGRNRALEEERELLSVQIGKLGLNGLFASTDQVATVSKFFGSLEVVTNNRAKSKMHELVRLKRALDFLQSCSTIHFQYIRNLGFAKKLREIRSDEFSALKVFEEATTLGYTIGHWAKGEYKEHPLRFKQLKHVASSKKWKSARLVIDSQRKFQHQNSHILELSAQSVPDTSGILQNKMAEDTTYVTSLDKIPSWAPIIFDQVFDLDGIDRNNDLITTFLDHGTQVRQVV